MNGWWKVAFGVVCGLLGAGFILLVSSQPRGQAIKLSPAPTPAPIVVHVVGAVADPGVYSLPAGSRVQDAIQAAGGLLPDAYPNALNLAAWLEDGERVPVPTLPPANPTSSGPSRSNPVLTTPDTDHPLNINTASQVELENLPGIGPITAQRIIAYRETNGPFTAIEDIQDVSGIASKKFEAIQHLITVGVFP